jgi:hypothetical protein
MVTIARDVVREPLYTLVPYFNPWRNKSRVKHTERALKHFHDSGCTIVFVETCFGRRESDFETLGLDGTLTNCDILGVSEFRHKHVVLRTSDEFWHKEDAVNLGVQRALPHNWQQMCWLDADIQFLRPNWVGECIQKLQHYAFLQPFSDARDVGPNYELLPQGYTHAQGPSFVNFWRHQTNRAPSPVIRQDIRNIKRDLRRLERDIEKLEHDLCPPYPGPIFYGLAWACTRKAYDDVGGIFDKAVWGGSDYDMAHALTEQCANLHLKAHPNYRKMLLEWEDRCRRYIRKNVGMMEGTLVHYWHGRKSERQYSEKRKLMGTANFDPLRHLKRDSNGLLVLHDDGSENFILFRDQMRRISKERNEDSNEI